MDIFSLLREYLQRMELILQILSENKVKPFYENEIYDYKKEQKTKELAIFLKLILLKNYLSSCIYLLKEGRINESVIICRAIYEITEDIYFFHLESKIEILNLEQYKGLINYYRLEGGSLGYACKAD